MQGSERAAQPGHPVVGCYPQPVQVADWLPCVVRTRVCGVCWGAVIVNGCRPVDSINSIAEPAGELETNVRYQRLFQRFMKTREKTA